MPFHFVLLPLLLALDMCFQKYKGVFVGFLLLVPGLIYGQFYNGSSMRFGKNRVQHEEFQWFFRKYDQYNIYYYEGGSELSLFAADIVEASLENLAKRFDFYYEDNERINIMVYNKLEDFRQSNMGLNEEENNNIGGVTQIFGRNVFVYFDGNHDAFEKNIKQGVSRVFAQQMIFGDSWLEIMKNSALLTVPNWYIEGLTMYTSAQYKHVEPLLKDAIQNKRFAKFNRLNTQESELFGYALWNYISEVYGEKLIPNVLYMSRVSRGVENGFLYVLGVSFKQLKNDMIEYYESKYGPSLQDFSIPKEAMNIKTKKKFSYRNISLNPMGDKLAYVRQYLGKSKVFIVDLKTGKKTSVFRYGTKTERIEDSGYPLIAWHPDGEILSVVYSKSFEVKLKYCSENKKEKTEKTLFKVDKVTSFSYAPDGKKIILSAIAEGASDLYLYTISSGTNEKITKDIYDDLDPVFTDKNYLLFSSNRSDDTLRSSIKQEKEFYQDNFDLFGYDLSSTSGVLTRLTQTPENERKPQVFDQKQFAYLKGEGRSWALFRAQRDSSISFVDTSIHYRYFIKSTPIESPHPSMYEYAVQSRAKDRVELFFLNGKPSLIAMPKISPMGLIKKPTVSQTNIDTSRVVDKINTVTFVAKKYVVKEQIPLSSDEKQSPEVDTDYYIFSNENPGDSENSAVDKKPTPSEDVMVDTMKQKPRIKNIPSARKYLLNYTASDVTSQMDFDFANQIYQHFNGGPYVPPGMGVVLKVDAKDLFEDYKLEGGIRIAFNGGSTEYFASLENRSGRWDKLYTYQRQSSVFTYDFYSTKTLTQSIKARYSYPFSEVSSVRITPSLRRDRGTVLSSDAFTLPVEDAYENWGGIKLEYIYDDSREKGVNLYHGTKWKVFGEHYRVLDDFSTDFYVLGTDLRHSIKIHRDLIWVNRLSAGFSFGERKLVHYLGSVDNWIYLSENPRFDTKTPISNEAGYYFQTITPPLRGFIQNARNGNNFALINSELRFPVFKYFMSKPIRSEFLSNFQIIGFGDVGTAWTGPNPYSEENAFNTKTIQDGNITVTVKNQTDPIAAGIGWGLRSTLFGYFIRFDRAWGIENYDFKKPRYYFSLGLDF